MTDQSTQTLPENREERLLSKLESLLGKIDTQFEKTMEGFHAIERSFKMCAGRMISFSEDLNEALGKIESDPFEL